MEYDENQCRSQLYPVKMPKLTIRCCTFSAYFYKLDVHKQFLAKHFHENRFCHQGADMSAGFKFRKHSFLLVILFSLSGLQLNAANRSGTMGKIPWGKQELVSKVQVGTVENRVMAIEECGTSRFKFCYRPLIENLLDPELDIRKASALSLARLQIEDAALPLFEALEKADKDITAREEELKELSDKLKQETDPVEKSVLVDNIIYKKKRYQTAVDYHANLIYAIGEAKADAASEKILPLLDDENPTIRRRTATALGKIKKEEAKEKLAAKLDNEKVDWVRVEILRALIEYEPANSKYRIQLINYLQNNDMWVRMYAARAIYDLKIYEGRIPLEKALRLEAEPMVRMQMKEAYLLCLNPPMRY